MKISKKITTLRFNRERPCSDRKFIRNQSLIFILFILALNLLKDRESDEAYPAADPGRAYILYYPASGQGRVKLDLSEYEDTGFNVNWVDINKGNWDRSKTTTIAGGGAVAIDRPAPGHWVAAITKIVKK